MVRPSRPAPLMLDEPFMLFSGPCSAAEQGAGMLSPCSDKSPKPPQAITTNASSNNMIHVHPHTVAGSRTGGSHFNAPSPPRKHHGKQHQQQAAAAVSSTTGPAAGAPPPPSASSSGSGSSGSGISGASGAGARNRPRGLKVEVAMEPAAAEAQNQGTMRSDTSLEACLDLPQRPATTRARGGAFNSFFFSKKSNGGASGGNTPAGGKKKKRAFPGFTPRGLSGVGFGLATPRQGQQQGQGLEKPGLTRQGSGSPIFGSLTRGGSFMALLTRRPSLGGHPSASGGGSGSDDMDTSTSTSATSSLSASSSHSGHGAPHPAAAAATSSSGSGTAASSPVDLYAAAMNFHYDGTKILEWLYMGGESIPSQQALAQTFGISHIVNTTMDAHYPHHDPAHGDYCQLFLRDCVRQGISPETFQRAFDMIERARHHGEKCLVHCRNGMSRSATIVIAYLMKYQGMRLIDALAHARGRRPCVSPNPGFMDLLCEMERAIFGEVSLDTHHYHDDRFASIESLRLPLGGLPDLVPIEAHHAHAHHGPAGGAVPSPKGAAAAAE